MIRCLACLAVWLTSTPVFAADPQAAPEESPGMRSLFNGKDLTGWDGDPRLWSVRDGVIHGETSPENATRGNTFLICKGVDVKDFELRLSFRCGDANNSGIQYRSRHITEGNPANGWVVRGYQHEIRNSDALPDVAGFIYDEGGKRGRICLVGEEVVWDAADGKKVVGTIIDQEGFRDLFKVGEWNDVVIVAEGDHIRHYLNGRQILDFTDDPGMALKQGILAVQLHAGAPMWVEFKDVRLKEIE